MIKRLPYLLVFVVLLSLVLVACGDETAPVPTYPGATSIPVPDAVKTQFASSLSQFNNGTIEAYKTTDDLSKVKSGFDSNYKSAGWDDKTSTYVSASDSTTIQSAGMVIVAYQKGNKAAVNVGMPNAIATAPSSGFTGLNGNENVFLVISGNAK